jgi:hypothetical protein
MSTAIQLDPNLLKLMTNYVLSKFTHELLTKRYDLIAYNENILVQLVDGFHQLKYDLNSSLRYKFFMAIVISRLMSYFERPTEQKLHQLVQVVFDRSAERNAPLDLLEKLKSVISKKVGYQ